ncbi:hypothetical protein SK128_027849, partial [Halocaridina rubra]
EQAELEGASKMKDHLVSKVPPTLDVFRHHGNHQSVVAMGHFSSLTFPFCIHHFMGLHTGPLLLGF